MKSLNNQEILDEVSKVTQKIKETQLHISENLCKVLTAFESSNAEDLQKEILAIKKYNPEAYQEYLKVRSKLRLHEKKERKENSLNQDSSISSSQEQL